MQNMINLFDYGPTFSEIMERDKKRLCTSIKFKNGSSYFWCDNICKPYLLSFAPLHKPLKIWIQQSMICENCLGNLKNKYGIDFKKEIPKKYFSKGWVGKNYRNLDNFSLIKKLNEISKEKNISYLNNETVWWKQIYFLLGLPFYWLNSFDVVETFEKGNKNQGNFNGPDFIFQNVLTKELIGFEVVSYKWNIFSTFKDSETAEKFAKEKIYNLKNFDERIEEFKNIIGNKIKKNYVKTDELYLGIVVSNTLVDYEYYVLELILDKYIKCNNLPLNGVFIL